MSEGAKKSTDLLNTAEFRDKRDEAMLRSHRAGNRRLRLIPEVRDHGDKLTESPDTGLEKEEEDGQPPVSPRPDASKAILILETSLPIMTEDEIGKVRSMLPHMEKKESSKPTGTPLFTVFYVGVIIGALLCLFAYRAYLHGYPTAETESKEAM